MAFSTSKAFSNASSKASKQFAYQSNARSITNILNISSRSIANSLGGSMINAKEKANIDKQTMETVKECSLYVKEIIFNKIQIYARPISAIGSHNTNNTSQQENKENALKAASGFHHVLLMLFTGPKPIIYICDRVEGVRFVNVEVTESELMIGHLKMIREYNNMCLKWNELRKFILLELPDPYNLFNNNCICFAFKFINNLLKTNNKWAKLDDFWKFVQSNFDKNDIQNGKYDQQQNDYKIKKEVQTLKHQQQIKLINDLKKRQNWKNGDAICVLVKNFKGADSWYIGKIREIDPVNDKLTIVYTKMNKKYVAKASRSDKKIKPYVPIPSAFLDPITNKIMLEPVQLVKSGVVYDKITVQYFQFLEYSMDPIIGVPITEGKGARPFVLKRNDLKQRIKEFRAKHVIDPTFINSFKHVHAPKTWDIVDQTLRDKFDIKKQQEAIYHRSSTIFFPENESKTIVDINTDDDKKNDIDIKNVENEDYDAVDLDVLKCNHDQLYIGHTKIPIITCMGPSRKGKSFLLNSILQNQPSWKENKTLKQRNVFETSKSSNIPLTKGAWISLYGDVHDGPYTQFERKTNNDDIVLCDYCPQDDMRMWTTEEVVEWLKSLHPQFEKKYKDILLYMSKVHPWKGLSTIKSEEILINKYKMDKKTAKSFKQIILKRSAGVMDKIEYNPDNGDVLKQMYLIDMEGLSHGVTKFTIKLFQGCYAISNVILWFDSDVMSDNFKKFMKRIKKNMEVVRKSGRKPAFMYVLRNADLLDPDCFKSNEDGDDSDDIDDDDDSDMENEFDEFIKKDRSFKWLHDMNIFSSIHGYSLDAPENIRRSKRKKGMYYKEETINDLTDKIKEITNKTGRFITNGYTLREQVNNLNKHDTLSIEKKIALNSRLRIFVLNRENANRKKLQITKIMIKFNHNQSEIEHYYKNAYQSVLNKLKKREIKISKKFSEHLKQNKTEIMQEIKKWTEKKKKLKNDQNSNEKAHWGSMALQLGGILGMAVATGGTSVALQVGAMCLYGVGGVGQIYFSSKSLKVTTELWTHLLKSVGEEELNYVD